MTSNQRRAIALANNILNGRIDAAALSEHDWDLLLLAAGFHRVSTPPARVARRVLEDAERLDGYFADALHPYSHNGGKPIHPKSDIGGFPMVTREFFETLLMGTADGPGPV